MNRKRFIVVDSNIGVDTVLAALGRPAWNNSLDRRVVARIWARMGKDVVIDGELVQVIPVISAHIRGEITDVLRRKKGLWNDQITKGFDALGRLMSDAGGRFDGTSEDMHALMVRNWARSGCGTKDEAVLACAERHEAAVLTQDGEFRRYLSERGVANFSAAEFLAAASHLV